MLDSSRWPRPMAPQDLRALHAALMAAFPTPSALDLVLSLHLGVALSAISEATDQPTLILRAIKWAEARGRLLELLHAAGESNPANPVLQEFMSHADLRPPEGADLFFIPYEHNTFFVGRSEELEQIAESLNAEHCVALVGPGGIGKTQLAIEYAHAYRAAYPGGVFWLAMEQAESIPRQIAQYTDPKDLDNTGGQEWQMEDKVQVVRAEWEKPTARLVIMDNLEDRKLLAEWRPQRGGCHMLVTTRISYWSQRSKVKIHRVPKLPPAASRKLLISARAQRQDVLPENLLRDPGPADRICEILGHLPLALALAASYLERYEGVSLAAYYNQLGDQPLDHRSLQDLRAAEDLPTKHIQSIARTFMLSYTQLNTSEPVEQLARTLLHHAAQCAPVPIPRALLLAAVGRNPDLTVPDEETDEAVLCLLGFGLIERVSNPDLDLDLHRLVAAFVRSQTTDAPGERQAVEQALCTLGLAASRTESPQAVRPYVEHLQWTLGRAITPARAPDLTATLHYTLAEMLCTLGDWRTAIEHAEQALACREETAGVDSLAVADSLYQLGRLHLMQSDQAAARECLERAYAIRVRQLGENHRATLQAFHYRGYAAQMDGDLRAARQIYEQTLAARQVAFSDRDADTAESLADLGAVLQDLGDLAGAQELLEQALHIRQQILGPDDPKTAISHHDLGLLLHLRGELAQADREFEHAFTSRALALGSDHPLTGVTLHASGMLLKDWGDWSTAQERLEQAITIAEKRWGANHWRTASSLNQLGHLHYLQGDLAQARPLIQRAFIIRKAQGQENAGLAFPLTNLGLLEQAEGHWTAAQAALRQALALRRKAYGRKKHYDTATSLNNLGNLLRLQGQHERAHDLLKRALDMRRRLFDTAHHETAQSLYDYGLLLIAMGNPETARPLLEEALAMRELRLQPQHPDIAASRAACQLARTA